MTVGVLSELVDNAWQVRVAVFGNDGQNVLVSYCRLFCNADILGAYLEEVEGEIKRLSQPGRLVAQK